MDVDGTREELLLLSVKPAAQARCGSTSPGPRRPIEPPVARGRAAPSRYFFLSLLAVSMLDLARTHTHTHMDQRMLGALKHGSGRETK